MRPLPFALFLAALISLATASLAAPGGLPNATHGESSPEWENLRAKIFTGRPIESAPERQMVQLVAPLRAAYGASVPIKVVSKLPQRPDLFVKRVYLFVDKNPSPLAAVIELTPTIGQADFETRLRVDEYSHVRVVSELSNGELHTDSRYVKTSGGCSAPPNRSAPNLIGKTVFKLPERVKFKQPNIAEVTVIHPNDTGFELNSQTGIFIPPHFVRSIKATYGDQMLFEAELDFSVSENPTLRFSFVPPSPGQLRAEVTDSKGGQFSGTLAVAVSP